MKRVSIVCMLLLVFSCVQAEKKKKKQKPFSLLLLSQNIASGGSIFYVVYKFMYKPYRTEIHQGLRHIMYVQAVRQTGTDVAGFYENHIAEWVSWATRGYIETEAQKKARKENERNQEHERVRQENSELQKHNALLEVRVEEISKRVALQDEEIEYLRKEREEQREQLRRFYAAFSLAPSGGNRLSSLPLPLAQEKRESESFSFSVFGNLQITKPLTTHSNEQQLMQTMFRLPMLERNNNQVEALD